MFRAREKSRHTCQSGCVWVTLCFCISEWERHIKRCVYESIDVCVHMCARLSVCMRQRQSQRETLACLTGLYWVDVWVFFHFWARETYGQMCIQISKCAFVFSCACVLFSVVCASVPFSKSEQGLSLTRIQHEMRSPSFFRVCVLHWYRICVTTWDSLGSWDSLETSGVTSQYTKVWSRVRGRSNLGNRYVLRISSWSFYLEGLTGWGCVQTSTSAEITSNRWFKWAFELGGLRTGQVSSVWWCPYPVHKNYFCVCRDRFRPFSVVGSLSIQSPCVCIRVQSRHIRSSLFGGIKDSEPVHRRL